MKRPWWMPNKLLFQHKKWVLDEVLFRLHSKGIVRLEDAWQEIMRMLAECEEELKK